jgi:hypothetical protein
MAVVQRQANFPLVLLRRSNNDTEWVFEEDASEVLIESSSVRVAKTDKGRILVAKRSFKAGEVIFEEAPLVIVVGERRHFAKDQLGCLTCICKELCEQGYLALGPSVFLPMLRLVSLGSDMQQEVLEKFFCPAASEVAPALLATLHHALKMMHAQKLFDLLRQRHTNASVPKERTLISLILISLANVFGEGGTTQVLPIMGALLNHSCLPNCCWAYLQPKTTGESGRFVERALVDIEVGEELTHSYLVGAL